jgi:uncharacterized membrane protein YhhN
MNKTRAFIFFLFWLALVADCFLIFSAHAAQRIYTKPVLVPLLMLAIYIESKNTKHTTSQILINIAFFFCFLGDFSLLNETDSGHFTLGLVSFLIAHLFFSFFFYRLRPFRNRYLIFIFTTVIVILIYDSLLLFLIWKNVSVQSFQVPITVYSIILGVMLLCAVNTFKNRSIRHISSSYFIPGAILFVISDSILAISKFSIPFKYSGVPVMVTYGAAVFLIANGAIRFLKK